MTRQRRQPRAQRPAMLAWAAVQERQSVQELAAEYELHPTQIRQWTRQLREGLPDLCSSRRGPGAGDEAALPGQVYQESGRLKRALAWVNKKAAPVEHRPARPDGGGAGRVPPPASGCGVGAAALGRGRCAGGGTRREPEVEARDRRPIPPGALLWQAAPDCLAVPCRVSGASPAGAAADAHAGTGGD